LIKQIQNLGEYGQTQSQSIFQALKALMNYKKYNYYGLKGKGCI
jgi:hypothetical protein